MKIYHHTITLFGEPVIYCEPDVYHGPRLDKMIAWLEESIDTTRWTLMPSMKVAILFKHEEDLLMFKLRWGGNVTVSV